MFTYDNILAALQNGKSATDIGNEFAELLNKALTEQREAENKAKEQAKREKMLNEAADKVFDALVEYFKLADPSLAEDFADMKVTDKRKCLEEAAKMMRMTEEVINHVLIPSKSGVDHTVSSYKIMNDFLKNYID